MSNVVNTSNTSSSSSNGSQACAACKYQRRRCVPDCPLASYFPAERRNDFMNAHRLFGVSNILKVIKNVGPSQKDNAMKALIFEANIHAGDPVGGCYRVVWNLHRQINLYKAELELVYRQIQVASAIQEQRNGNSKDCYASGIDDSRLNFDVSSLYDSLDGFDRCKSNFQVVKGGRLEDGSNSRVVLKGERLEDVSNSRVLKGERVETSLNGFDRCKSNFQVVKGERWEGGSNSRVLKGKRFESFNGDEEFETKAMIPCSNDKELFEYGDFKPYFGKFYDYKGKGVAKEVRLPHQAMDFSR